MNDIINLSYKSILYYLITVFWLGEFIFFPGNFKKKQWQGKGTFNTILVIIIFNIFLSIFFTVINFTNLWGLAVLIIRNCGLILYFMGLLIRYYSIILLGHSFTRVVVISKEEELVSNGLYTYLRHPLYLGLILLAVGAVTYIGNLMGILITIISMFIVINKRIKEEEEYMEKIMSDKYIKWKEKRYRLIPFVY